MYENRTCATTNQAYSLDDSSRRHPDMTDFPITSQCRSPRIQSGDFSQDGMAGMCRSHDTHQYGDQIEDQLLEVGAEDYWMSWPSWKNPSQSTGR